MPGAPNRDQLPPPTGLSVWLDGGRVVPFAMGVPKRCHPARFCCALESGTRACGGAVALGAAGLAPLAFAAVGAAASPTRRHPPDAAAGWAWLG